MGGNVLGASVGFAMATCWFAGVFLVSRNFANDKRRSVYLANLPPFVLLTITGWSLIGPRRFGGKEMMLSDHGMLGGAIVGSLSLAFCLALAGRVDLPETRLALEVSGLIQLVFFPVAGWFVAPLLFGE